VAYRYNVLDAADISSANAGIPGTLVEQNDACRTVLQAHAGRHGFRNPHVRVLLSQTPNWKALELDVPQHRVLACLWKNFQPVGRLPFRPVPKEKGCDALLMVRYLKAEQQLFWEPATRNVSA